MSLQDKCGAPVTTTASLEVRCNNPPVPVIGNTDISVDTYTGAEVLNKLLSVSVLALQVECDNVDDGYWYIFKIRAFCLVG